MLMLEESLTKHHLHTTDNYIKSLNKWGIFTIWDFLNIFPKSLDDRSNILESFSYVNIKEKNTILVKLISIENQKTASGKLLTKAVFEDKNGFLCEWVWFNRGYFANQISKFIGKEVMISGRVKYDYGRLSFWTPEIITDIHKNLQEVVPVYSDCNYIPGSWIASKMEYLKPYTQYFEETLPKNILEKYNFLSKADAMHQLHFPKNKREFEQAKNRLAYDELYAINYTSLTHKKDIQNASTGKSLAISLDANLIKSILEKLPFSLTNHQKIALFQVLKDMEKTHSMQRLLQGDVGTGKTIVAAVVVIHTFLQSQAQSVILAPTEILSTQHFLWLQKIFWEYGIKTELLTGSTPKKQKEEIKQQLKNGEINVIIGTHALLEDDVKFQKLGLVVIDEQHRFWVKQREALEKYNNWHIYPHSLNMTATPIPRTLAITLYGDQDLSIISEYPAGRKEIFTKVVTSESQRWEVEKFVRNQIESGRQVFWISPLVEESEKLDLANAISTFESLQEIFSPFKVGLLHGKMKGKEKKEIMDQFTKNEIQILSSTSVVEVWVDVPNATIMCIEWAERFWLSQLHQFRGRVGRGEYQSYCYLFPSSWQKTDRLKAMEKTNNGFELSEIDLELRWPGEVYGVRQSGLPDLKIADIKDLELVSQIREDIENLVLK